MSDLPLLGVITLPALAPLIALIQLLFPGLLGEHWKQYRAAIGVMLTQSTLYMAQWAALTWFVSVPTWWLTDEAVAWGGVIVAGLGYLGAVVMRPVPQPAAPVRVEYLAFWGLLVASGGWLAVQVAYGKTWLDPLLVIALASLTGVIHLQQRRRWAPAAKNLRVPTEVLFLLVLMVGGAALTAYTYETSGASGSVASVAGESSTYRRDAQRTGSADAADSGPNEPVTLWEFDPATRRGQVFLDSSPTVVDGLVYLGARREISALQEGVLYCINARADRRTEQGLLQPGEPVWSYDDPSLRPVFSSSSVVDGKLFVGEGYHQNKNCRLFCFDAARGGAPLWSRTTISHVESTPTIVSGRIYFGAGDDGLLCLEPPADAQSPPKTLWHVKEIHIDASPLVAEGRVFAGGVVGDVVNRLALLAVDADSGEVLWRLPAEIPVAAAPAWHDGGVIAALGNGKLNQEAERPAGAVWRVNAASGEREWEFPVVSSVLTSPAVANNRVYFTARNGESFCLDAKTGRRLWRSPLGEPVLTSPIVSGGRVFILSAHGTLHCLDAETGHSRWTFTELRRAAADVFSSPVLDEGRLYLCVGGKLYCVGDRQ